MDLNLLDGLILGLRKGKPHEKETFVSVSFSLVSGRVLPTQRLQIRLARPGRHLDGRSDARFRAWRARGGAEESKKAVIQCKLCGRKPNDEGTVLKRTNTSKAKVAQFICAAGTGCRDNKEPWRRPWQASLSKGH